MTLSKNSQTRPDCYKCCHFYITHDAAHPYGCRAMQFKSKVIPTVAVMESSGMECQLFTPKK
jgi:hypothetical protein